MICVQMYRSTEMEPFAHNTHCSWSARVETWSPAPMISEGLQGSLGPVFVEV